MTGHVLRPLWAAGGVLTAILVIRTLMVPSDFGVGPSGYMYGWHRAGNEAEWKAMTPQYRFDNSYCKDCHSDNYTAIQKSPHSVIKCENCHGPAKGHPDNPTKLQINRDRSLCGRCHSALPGKLEARSKIKSIDLATHNANSPCVTCHNPHTTQFGGSK